MDFASTHAHRDCERHQPLSIVSLLHYSDDCTAGIHSFFGSNGLETEVEEKTFAMTKRRNRPLAVMLIVIGLALFAATGYLIYRTIDLYENSPQIIIPVGIAFSRRM